MEFNWYSIFMRMAAEAGGISLFFLFAKLWSWDLSSIQKKSYVMFIVVHILATISFYWFRYQAFGA